MSTIEDEARARLEEQLSKVEDYGRALGNAPVKRATFNVEDVRILLAASRREPSEALSTRQRAQEEDRQATVTAADDIKALVTKLREKPSYWHQPTYEFLHRDAADTIEKLEAENSYLRGEREHGRGNLT